MMMKKLLVLMLVLGFAGIAQAGTLDLVITSRGPGPDATEPLPQGVYEITIQDSEWIDMDVIYTPGVAPLQQASFTISVQGAATLDLGALTLPPGAWDPTFSPGPAVVEEGKVYNVQYNWGFSYPGVQEGIAVDHILLHCDSPDGLVTVTIVDWVLVGSGSLEGPVDGPLPVDVIGQVTIHQIPEPMTVALLGLGGLFLLRRRK
jgi:hypothetical protein